MLELLAPLLYCSEDITDGSRDPLPDVNLKRSPMCACNLCADYSLRPLSVRYRTSDLWGSLGGSPTTPVQRAKSTKSGVEHLDSKVLPSGNIYERTGDEI